MGTQAPKQFLLLQGKPVLWHTLRVFLDAYEDLAIILVLPPAYMGMGQAIVESTGAAHRIRLAAGGATRFHSVQSGLQLIGEPSVIFVHDGVRCLLTTGLVQLCYESALQYGSAVPVISSKDSVRLVSAGGNEVIDRNLVKLVQTPQTFLSELLLPSYQQEYRESFTDEATVVEAAGGRVHLVEGEANNIKITTPADLAVAEQLLLQ
jgi:2-C-methyl-D-erythritol 4-phosphate cytidylyltransferase